MKTFISCIAMAIGLLLMAGSAGDCDGGCVGQANSIGEMITYSMIGLSLFAGGTTVLIKGA
jgi:hypothetical protein